AARVARREDAGEGDDAIVAGGLDATQVVLVLDALGIHRVAPLAIAVPDIYRGAGQGRTAPGRVLDRELDGQRDATGFGRRCSEARSDVAPDDAALGQHIRPV